MKRVAYKMLMMFLLSLMLVSCDSCEDKKVDVVFTYTCTSDLLKQVVPVISYTDKNGTRQIVELTEEMMVNSSTTNVKHDGTTVSVTGLGNYSWQNSVHFDDFGVSCEVTVTYKLLPNAEEMVDRLYLFNHSLICSVFVESDGNPNIHTMDIEENDRINLSLGLEDARSYIQNLLNEKDHRKVTVDKGGTVSREK